MGGTSTDVTHYAGAYERAFDSEVAGVRLRAPMLRIHTVAAGGGSIIAWDGARLRVGPHSAGASPGPLSYRRGGPLTITDANVMTGKILPQHFPAIFGANGNEPLDAQGVRAAFADLAQRMNDGRAPEAIADGCIEIAVAGMAEAIKKISVARGYDVTGYVLNCFGGAGGQHACLVADRSAWDRCCCIRCPPSCRPTAWALPICRPCAPPPSSARSMRTDWPRWTKPSRPLRSRRARNSPRRASR